MRPGTCWWVIAGLLGACRKEHALVRLDPPAASAAEPRVGPPPTAAPPRRGMVWIPPGALVAGTPLDARPRVADQEMPGEQVILKGFYVDLYPYPNEEGAIPQTNVTQFEAQHSCETQGKRLCTELEWERACKGPDNRIYEYGDRYLANRCDTGKPARLVPSGINAACVSDFGVRDLHGGVWEWTSSSWGRGENKELVTVRGGNGTAGEVFGRCAHGQGRRPGEQDGLVGFRCCQGPENAATVMLRVVHGKKLELQDHVDKQLAADLLRALPQEARTELGQPENFRFYQLWLWRPIGNEELTIAGGCTGIGVRPACGVLVTRIVLEHVVPLTWISSGHWVPLVRVDVDPLSLWLSGGDQLGQFRVQVNYQSGDILVGPRERRLPKPEKRHKRKR